MLAKPLVALCSLALTLTVDASAPAPYNYNTTYEQGEKDNPYNDQISPSRKFQIPDGECSGFISTDSDLWEVCQYPYKSNMLLRIEVLDQSDVAILISSDVSNASIYRSNNNESGLCPGSAVVQGFARCHPVRSRHRRSLPLQLASHSRHHRLPRGNDAQPL